MPETGTAHSATTNGAPAPLSKAARLALLKERFQRLDKLHGPKTTNGSVACNGDAKSHSPSNGTPRKRYSGARSLNVSQGPVVSVTHSTVVEIAEAVADKRLNIPTATTARDSRGAYTGIRRPAPARHEDTPITGKGFLLDCGKVLGNLPHGIGNLMQDIWGPSVPRMLFDMLVPDRHQCKFRTNSDRETMLRTRLTSAEPFVRAALASARGFTKSSGPVILRRAIFISETLAASLGAERVKQFVTDFTGQINELDGGHDGYRALVDIWRLIPKQTFSPDGEIEVVTRMKPASLMPIALKAYREAYKLGDAPVVA